VVVAGNCLDGEVREAVDLQLEGHGWFQVPVDGVLRKLCTHTQRPKTKQI